MKSTIKLISGAAILLASLSGQAIAQETIKVGMSDEDIERFAALPGIPKVSSRDLPVVLARGGLGATTVASSVVAAEIAGIPWFSSAGIGGVHRGAQETFGFRVQPGPMPRHATCNPDWSWRIGSISQNWS